MSPPPFPQGSPKGQATPSLGTFPWSIFESSWRESPGTCTNKNLRVTSFSSWDSADNHQNATTNSSQGCSGPSRAQDDDLSPPTQKSARLQNPTKQCSRTFPPFAQHILRRLALPTWFSPQKAGLRCWKRRQTNTQSGGKVSHTRHCKRRVGRATDTGRPGSEFKPTLVQLPFEGEATPLSFCSSRPLHLHRKGPPRIPAGSALSPGSPPSIVCSKDATL